MKSLSDDKHAKVIEAFDSTSCYLDDRFKYFEYMANQIYPPELQLNKDNA